MKKLMDELKIFALKGNVVDMAVGIIVGAAFALIAKSLVSDVLMPPIGLLLGDVDFSNMFMILKEGSPASPYNSLADANAAGAITLNYGVFMNTVISFLVSAVAVFFVVRAINTLRKREEEAPAAPNIKECPFCVSSIPAKAIRCPYCTSTLAKE